jgi:dihydroxyacid dehydratase/phosphogluconate dehydratase
VFENIHDLAERVDDPTLDCDASSVMGASQCRSRRGPGMPEWGHLPIPAKLLKQGVTDLVRISDARMSGTSYGAVISTSPPSRRGRPSRPRGGRGPHKAGRDGRQLDVVVDEAELAERRSRWTPPAPSDDRGYRHLHVSSVLQANEGCDFDFLRGRTRVVDDAVTYL